MFKRTLVLVITTLLEIITSSAVRAQGIDPRSATLPSFFSNRRMGYLSDASSVGWNPAMLGIRNEFDLMLAVPLNTDINGLPSSSRLHTFAKLGPVGLGYIFQRDSSLPAQYFGGFGIPLNKNRTLNMGISAMYQDLRVGSLADKLRGNISVMYIPTPMLWLSGGVSTIHGGGSDNLMGNFAAAFTPVDWFGLHANFDLLTKTELIPLFADGINFQAGLTLSPWDDFVLSGMYNPSMRLARVGVEVNIDSYGLGYIQNIPEAGRGTGALIGRYQPDRYMDLPTYVASLSGSSLDGGGSRDASCRPEPYKWTRGTEQVSGTTLMNTMMNAGSEYTKLYSTLQSLSPAADKLYAAIGEKYYGIKPVATTAGAANTTIIRPRETGNTIVIDSVSSTQGETTVIFRVRDANNRNTGGLKRENFFLADTTQQITNFAQTASQKRVAADFMILMDCSGSMSTSIASVRTNVQNFSRSLANRNIDYRIGSILYNQAVFATLPPTTNLNEFTTFFAQASASGYDEITSDAIMKSADVPYRADAEKIAILITDDCSMQGNTDYTEQDLIEQLWKSGVRLYGVINPTNHNAGFTTRLTLGKEYNIKSPFNSILDDISGEITTTYQLTYKEKPPVAKPIPPKVIVRGTVQSESGWNLAASIEAISGTSRQTYKTNPLNGEYEFEAQQGKQLEMTATADDHQPDKKTLAVPTATKNDTLTQNFTLRQPKTILKGVVTDENKKPLQAKIKIEDGTTLALVREIETNAAGAYSIEIPEGNIYRLTPSVKEYIPTPADADMRTTKKGTVVTQDLMLTSIANAVEKGLTFKLKNIFFDTGKWDLRPESFEELGKLITFLNEYQTLRMEIGAHTDNVGKDDANMTLSQKRAQSVVDYLKGKGIAETRMNAKGYGKTVPVGTNDTPEGRQLNRRVEFKLVK